MRVMSRGRQLLAVCAGLWLLAAGWSACARVPGVEVPDVRTPPEVVTEILRLARVGPDDVVYDLGSGDGRIVIAAARDFGARGVGIELDPALVVESEKNARRARVAERTRFLLRDIFEADISEATVVTLFLLPRLNLRLMPKLKRELKRGARIVSHKFDMGDEWPPEQTRDVDGLEIFLWTVRD
jgi:SAM-dependent methyltransferase